MEGSKVTTNAQHKTHDGKSERTREAEHVAAAGVELGFHAALLLLRLRLREGFPAGRLTVGLGGELEASTDALEAVGVKHSARALVAKEFVRALNAVKSSGGGFAHRGGGVPVWVRCACEVSIRAANGIAGSGARHAKHRIRILLSALLARHARC